MVKKRSEILTWPNYERADPRALAAVRAWEVPKDKPLLEEKPKRKKKEVGRLSPSSIINSRKSAGGYRIQPVFEQGGALMIPSDEIIVGFKPPATLNWAEHYLAPFRNTQGIIGIREHGEDTYILKIDNPSDGRSYQVSQFLSRLSQVVFAEPNHIVIMLYGQDNSLRDRAAKLTKSLKIKG